MDRSIRIGFIAVVTVAVATGTGGSTLVDPVEGAWAFGPNATQTNDASAVDADTARIEISVTTTKSNAPAKAIVRDRQDVELELTYAELGSGTHRLRLVETDSLFDDEVRTFTVEGDSGTKTYRLDAASLSETKESDAELGADLVVKWGEESSSNTVRLVWVETSVYAAGFDQIPEAVPAGESVTVEFYGWTDASETHVRLMEDDPPLGLRTGGNDEQIRRTAVTGPGYFEGSFTFTPSDYTEAEESDGELELQVRSADEDVYSDIVRSVAVGDPLPEIDANVVDHDSPSGSFHAGETVRTRVVVENTGNTRHSFFVGYGVIDEAGEVYDDDGSTGTVVTLAPGERKTVTVAWTVAEDAPHGEYDVGVSVWKESDRSALETRLTSSESADAFEIVPEPATTEQPTEQPTTESPTTESPTTELPTTEPPTTEPPTAESPMTEPSTTESPTTVAVGESTTTTEEPLVEVQIPGFGALAGVLAVALILVRLGWRTR